MRIGADWALIEKVLVEERRLRERVRRVRREQELGYKEAVEEAAVVDGGEWRDKEAIILRRKCQREWKVGCW